MLLTELHTDYSTFDFRGKPEMPNVAEISSAFALHMYQKLCEAIISRYTMSMKLSLFARRSSASRTPSLVIGPLYCMAGASESGGFGGGNGCSNGVPCEGCIEVVEGTRGTFGALEEDDRGGGTKNEGLIRVARAAGAPSDESCGREVANEVSGRAAVVGEMIEGMGMGVRVGGADMAVRDCAE